MSYLLQADNTLPGFVFDTVRGILRKAEMSDKVDMCETLLRLGGSQDSDGMQMKGGNSVILHTCINAYSHNLNIG